MLCMENISKLAHWNSWYSFTNHKMQVKIYTWWCMVIFCGNLKVDFHRLSPNMNDTCICTEVLERLRALEAHDASGWVTETYQYVGIALSPLVSVLVDKLVNKLLAMCTPHGQQQPNGAWFFRGLFGARINTKNIKNSGLRGFTVAHWSQFIQEFIYHHQNSCPIYYVQERYPLPIEVIICE